jgi:hypothetical protein
MESVYNLDRLKYWPKENSKNFQDTLEKEYKNRIFKSRDILYKKEPINKLQINLGGSFKYVS